AWTGAPGRIRRAVTFVSIRRPPRGRHASSGVPPTQVFRVLRDRSAAPSGRAELPSLVRVERQDPDSFYPVSFSSATRSPFLGLLASRARRVLPRWTPWHFDCRSSEADDRAPRRRSPTSWKGKNSPSGSKDWHRRPSRWT